MMRIKIHGPQTTVEYLSQKLLRRWVPKWYEAFYDHERGGFYERVGSEFKPQFIGYRRLLTQCRQLATYSHAALCDGPFQPGDDLDACFDFIIDTFYRPETGSFIFSVDEQGQALDGSYDLYALAFVIFAFSHYYRLRHDERAKILARQALDFIDRYFRNVTGPGLYEALDENRAPVTSRLRRHESHMHFFESCLFAAETWQHDEEHGRAFFDMAGEMAALFQNGFYRPDQRVLSEYYDEQLTPVPDQSGHIITEPGHYCEWIWLLKKYESLAGLGGTYDALCRDLLDWANQHGWDQKYGGIYDELDEAGAVVTDTKRIWPFTEALKANALMLDSGMDKKTLKSRIAEMVSVFNSSYMQARGFWTEWLHRDLSPAVDYMPGTTPYHVYFGIMESREALLARGKTKSLRAGPVAKAYMLRRHISGWIARLRKSLRRTGRLR